jgi:hypothetical protein
MAIIKPATSVLTSHTSFPEGDKAHRGPKSKEHPLFGNQQLEISECGDRNQLDGENFS